MRRLCSGLACALLPGTARLAPAQAPKLQVLIITGRNGHDWRATTPQAKDELYANLKWQPEGSFHVLATAYDDHTVYMPNEKQPVPPGLNQPMLWTVQSLVRGAEWAATGAVTIPLPDGLK